MKYNYIKTNIREHVFYLTLAREAKRNAFTPTMVNEIAHAVDTVNKLDEISLFVLNAEGPVFCAGMDLKTYQDPTIDRVHPAIVNQDLSLGAVLDRLERPSIAIVEGDVIAGGFLFLLGCTYVFAKREVRFRLPEVGLGIFPFQVLSGLLRIMPEKKALQLCLDTSTFGSEKALELGLIDHLLENGKLDSLITSFSDKNSSMLSAALKASRAIRNMEIEEQYSYLLQCLEELKQRPDVREKMASSLRKR